MSHFHRKMASRRNEISKTENVKKMFTTREYELLALTEKTLKKWSDLTVWNKVVSMQKDEKLKGTGGVAVGGPL